ncbi:alpha/beta fold hydrolase [uncultured Bradyrhizobium sp.]|uniref:alpha/beta fold hydrolase n=1 Tax=uncultured Bradyrhizobium sp. TaxID=199684 RepID=UPI0035CC64F6
MAPAQPARVRTAVLDVAYEQSGPADAPPVLLLHGFPYDPRGFEAVAAIVNAAGFRTIIPYLRGYGGTRFLSADTLRSGEQAALGQDLLELLDALRIENAVLAGYDWGGRAACVVSALWPERVTGLVSCTGYNIQDIANSANPADPEQEARLWYQYYFHTGRGRNGLIRKRRELCRLLWKMWSPAWAFDDATFDRTAASFDNEDFVDVVIHSYRHRTGSAAGDPRYAAVEARLAAQPNIGVPAINLHGEVDGVTPASLSEAHGKHFTGPYQRRVLASVGHNVPQEAPQAFADAVLELCSTA